VIPFGERCAPVSVTLHSYLPIIICRLSMVVVALVIAWTESLAETAIDDRSSTQVIESLAKVGAVLYPDGENVESIRFLPERSQIVRMIPIDGVDGIEGHLMAKVRFIPELGTIIGRGAVEETVDGDGVRDADLHELSRFANLTHLQLRFARVSDVGVASLSQLINLKAIDISASGATAEGLRHLADLPKLESLHAASLPLTDNNSDFLANMTYLRELNISGTEIGTRTIRRVARLPNLRRLDLAGTKVSSADLLPLARVESLQVVNLASTNIDDDVFGLLRQIPSLDYVDLSGTAVTFRGISRFSEYLHQVERTVAIRILSELPQYDRWLIPALSMPSGAGLPPPDPKDIGERIELGVVILGKQQMDADWLYRLRQMQESPRP
jgi:hypothetical protein